MIIDVHSHAWAYPQHFGDDFRVQARRARARLTTSSSEAGPSTTGPALPVGLQIMCPAFEETRMLQVAYAYEQATPWHLRKAVVE